MPPDQDRFLAAPPRRAVAKTPGDEDFPVASWWLGPRVRRPILDFYRFARKADDIADDPALTPEEKLERLEAMAATAPGPQARRLLEAFRFDARGGRIESWDDLMAYCRMSAVPVGDFLLDLFGEGEAARGPAAALCAALQLLNHLKDCGRDWRLLGRSYLPRRWLDEAKITEATLAAPAAAPALRMVFSRLSEHIDGLLAEATPLPKAVTHRALRLQSATALMMAGKLASKLRRHDLLATDLALTGPEKAAATIAALWRYWRP